MKTINNWEECLGYINKLGIVSPTKPIGWRQQDLMAIVQWIETKAGNYPIKIRYHRSESGYYQYFTINGTMVKMRY